MNKYMVVILPLVSSLIFNKAQGQIAVDSVVQKNRIGVFNNRATSTDMIPEMVILLNYKHVLTMPEYLKIKTAGDVIKQYYIENKTFTGELGKVMMVESKNRDKYDKLFDRKNSMNSLNKINKHFPYPLVR